MDLHDAREFQATHVRIPLPTRQCGHPTRSRSLGDGLKAYAFPPTPLIPRVLASLRQDSVEVVIVAPWPPRRAWSLDLLDLYLEVPRVLPVWEFSPPGVARMILILGRCRYHRSLLFLLKLFWRSTYKFAPSWDIGRPITRRLFYPGVIGSELSLICRG